MTFSDLSLRRRDLATLGAAVVALPLVGLRPGPAAAAPATAGARLRLRPDRGGPGGAVDVALTPDPQVAARGAVLRTAARRTDRFALLGVTWSAGAGQVRVRVRGVGGAWGPWRAVPALRDLPDRDTVEGRRPRPGTEPLWVGDSDGVQVEVTGAVRDPVLTLVDPGDDPRDDGHDDGHVGRPRRRSLRPKVRSRRSWGAKERWASGRPKKVKTVEQVHVHHTATGNDYRRRDVPRILRAIYRYHTQSLGWSDVGYNFFVDRFGRIWAGRRDPDREIRGAHTLGFNHTSVGIAVLGSYQEAAPTPRVLAGIAKIAAWKLRKYHRDPLATTSVRSHGSDLYPADTWVTLPVIDGHRDTNETECPGQYLYDALPDIRLRTARRIRRARR
ncbi:N-acetylmuramoyl-L-alanine amidase [Nocardioides carbamazepini]|uniref:N-acetylmuramoyl-L-alanine amidase n=1 Tax=Nocardioides carbamazepini TaxID=2854259 RepID=UPI002149F6EA|nr:N-acetylmuramoyl-L-alanine amidase [Nocardioides carbamazepini]MCR1782078.1 N-acetylmuramoyl-L-alanine amidase [Nocardioides carbamazepini]